MTTGTGFDLEDLEKDRASVSKTQRPVCTHVASIAATRDVDGPLIVDDGLRLDSVWVSSTAALPTTFTFQVYYYLKGTKRFLGPAVSTAGLAVAAGVPFRLHKATRLRFDLPAGALLGVTVTRASGTLTNPTFHFNLTGG